MRSIRHVILIGAACVAVACSGEHQLAPAARGTAPPEAVQAALPGIPPWDEIKKKLPPIILDLAGAFDDLVTAYEKAKKAFDVTKMVLMWLGIIPTDNPDAKIDALKVDVANAAQGVSWQSTITFIDGNRGRCVDATNALMRNQGQLEELSIQDSECGSAAAAVAGSSPIAPPRISGAFLRTFNEITTDGLWKQVVPDRPQQINDVLVYDWRLGAPALMELVALRLLSIAAMDPNFRWGSHFRGELRQLRDSLRLHHDLMRGGIRCASDVAQVVGVGHICADIFTGAFSVQPLTSPAVDARTDVIYARLRSRLYQAMPLFQMRTMIDALSLYINAQEDITDGSIVGAVPHKELAPAGTNQCLDLPSGDANLCPLKLNDCVGATGQNWVYDRKGGTIVNLASGQCLAAGGQFVAGVFEALLGASAWSAPCNGGNEQKWTYDPDTQQMQSGIGTLLEVQAITPDTGTGNFCGPTPWRVMASTMESAVGTRWLAPQTCHNVCVEGAAIQLGATGGDSCNRECAQSVCAQDPFCCQVGWDGQCVAEVTSICGLKCK
jgi:hypothetical protein